MYRKLAAIRRWSRKQQTEVVRDGPGEMEGPDGNMPEVSLVPWTLSWRNSTELQRDFKMGIAQLDSRMQRLGKT